MNKEINQRIAMLIDIKHHSMGHLKMSFKVVERKKMNFKIPLRSKHNKISLSIFMFKVSIGNLFVSHFLVIVYS